MKEYIVMVYDENNNEIDRKTITTWNRREAYFEVMYKVKKHINWDTIP